MTVETAPTRRAAEELAAAHRGAGRRALVLALRAGVFEIRSWR